METDFCLYFAVDSVSWPFAYTGLPSAKVDYCLTNLEY